MVSGKKQWMTAALLTAAGTLALAAASSGARGSIVITVTANGNTDPNPIISTGIGSYNGVSWTSLNATDASTSSGGDQLSLLVGGLTNTANSGGSAMFSAVDNSFSIPAPKVAAGLQTSFTADVTNGVSGDGGSFLGGVSDAAATTPMASQAGAVAFITSTGSYGYSANKPLLDIRSYGLTGNINIYADAGASFNSPTTVNSLNTVTDVFPGPVTTPEPAPLASLIGLGTLGLLLRKRTQKL